MRFTMSPKHKKAAAGILAMFLLSLLLFSAFYVTAEAEHDCTGEDCPVCACIQQCESTLQKMGDGSAHLAAAILPAVFLLILSCFFVFTFPQETLVSIKVRLNN